MSEIDLINNANRLAERIQQAKQLRAEGAPEETINAIEPTKEEVRDALIALRSKRAAAPAPKPKRKAQSKMTMEELLKGGL